MPFPIKLPRQIWFIIFGLALLLAFAWVATTSGPLAPIRVTVAQVTRGDVSPSLFGIGTVEARRAYLIGPTTAGRVARVLVDVGDVVQSGQLLAEMDLVDLSSRMNAAQAAIARANSAVASAKEQVRDAHSRLALASAEARRYQDLGKQGFVGASVVEAKEQVLQSAQAQLAAANSALTGAHQDVTRLQAEHQGVAQQRANIRLLAPGPGVITARDAEPGSTVVAGQAVVHMVDPGSLWVHTRLDQSRSAGLAVGRPADIKLHSRAGDNLRGKVVRIEPISDSVTEERIAEIAFDALPKALSTGEMAEVTVHLPTVAQVLLVPNAAVRHRAGQAGVWVHRERKLSFVPIQVGAQGPDGMIQVTDGLQQGDEVVVYSQSELQPASRIKVVTTLVGPAK